MKTLNIFLVGALVGALSLTAFYYPKGANLAGETPVIMPGLAQASSAEPTRSPSVPFHEQYRSAPSETHEPTETF